MYSDYTAFVILYIKMGTESENQKAVLGSLLNKADSLTKKVISAYSPVVKYQKNLQNIRRLNADHIEAAAIFLGFNVRADDKKLYKNLQVLSDRVILKIESLFEANCTACGEIYCNTLEDSPLRSCYLCLQGSHNCDQMTEKCGPGATRPPGGVWLCYECLRKNDTALVPTATDPSTTDYVVLTQNEEVQNGDMENDQDAVAEAGDRISPRRNRDDNDNPASHGVVCEAYKRRACPHGLTGKRLVDGKPCPHNHPPRCFRYCKHGDNKRLGCVKGKDCKYLHPKLCNNSLLKRVCFYDDCQFHHLKHTRRYQNGRSDTNTDTVSEKGGQHTMNKPRQKIRFSSMSTIGGTPYAPTVQKRGTVAADDIKETNQSDSSFLLHLIENMKEGIILQMSEKLTEFQATIPELVKEQLLMNRPPQLPPVPRYQFQAPHQLPAPSFPQQFPACSY